MPLTCVTLLIETPFLRCILLKKPVLAFVLYCLIKNEFWIIDNPRYNKLVEHASFISANSLHVLALVYYFLFLHIFQLFLD